MKDLRFLKPIILESEVARWAVTRSLLVTLARPILSAQQPRAGLVNASVSGEMISANQTHEDN